GPATAVAGNSITYTLGVTNGGPSTAPNVQIQLSLPAGETVNSVTGTSPIGCNSGTPGNTLDPAGCSFGTLGPSDSRTMTVDVQIQPDVLGPIHADARASSDAFDSNTANNFRTVDTTVNGQADLSVTKAATPTPVVAGTPLSYQITVANGGPSRAAAPILTDPLDTKLSVTSMTVTGA